MVDAKAGNFAKAVKDLTSYVKTVADELTLCKLAEPEVKEIK